MINLSTTPPSSFSNINDQPKRIFNVVLDIDDVLASVTLRQEFSFAKITPQQIESFYRRKGAVLIVNKMRHYVFPGVVEFIRLLFQTEGVKVSFFSAAHKSRNEVFVPALLKRSLGDAIYETLHDNVAIFSEHHLCSLRKKLSSVLQGPIEDGVLVDNDPSNRAKGEENYFLYVPPILTKSFSILELMQEKYDGKGKTGIKCFINHFIHIRARKYISVDWWNGDLHIQFWHKKLKKYKNIVVSRDDAPVLYDLLKTHEHTKGSEIPKNSPIVNPLYEFVAMQGGQIKKICHRANRIYLLTALLFRALEAAKATNTPLSSHLPRIDLQLGSTYKTQKSDWMSDDELYKDGLKRLRSINPELTFIYPQNYMAAAIAPLC